MRMHQRTGVFFCLLGMAVSASGLAQVGQPVSPSPQQEEVPFLTGGVGDDELAQLTEQTAGYNLRVLFAEQGGAYVSGVSATIRRSGGSPVLQVASGGPLLFAKLPPGTYEIVATYEGVSQVRRLSIGAKSRLETTIRW